MLVAHKPHTRRTHERRVYQHHTHTVSDVQAHTPLHTHAYTRNAHIHAFAFTQSLYKHTGTHSSCIVCTHRDSVNLHAPINTHAHTRTHTHTHTHTCSRSHIHMSRNKQRWIEVRLRLTAQTDFLLVCVVLCVGIVRVCVCVCVWVCVYALCECGCVYVCGLMAVQLNNRLLEYRSVTPSSTYRGCCFLIWVRWTLGV